MFCATPHISRGVDLREQGRDGTLGATMQDGSISPPQPIRTRPLGEKWQHLFIVDNLPVYVIPAPVLPHEPAGLMHALSPAIDAAARDKLHDPRLARRLGTNHVEA